MFRRKRWTCSQRDKGATVVEMAVVLPVFFLFLFALFEFGHAWMVINALNAAAKKAARQGVVDGVSTATVEARVTELLRSAIDTTNLTVRIRDAGIFDTADVDPTNIDYESLPPIELDDAAPRQLFIVQVEVSYDDVSIMSPYWITDLTLRGQSVMRHE